MKLDNVLGLKTPDFLERRLHTGAHNLWKFGCRAIAINGIDHLFLKHSKYTCVGKYYSVSQDVTHNEHCKWLNKNGLPKNFAKRGTDKLFLYDERKNISFENHFVTFKDESNEYSEKSWALFDKSFW